MAEQNDDLLYIHLPSGSDLPVLRSDPCRVIVLVEQDVASDWQDQVSEWIIGIGCLHMIAWGQDCSSWDDSVDWANLKAWDFEPIPDENFVMTVWHENEPMNEAFVDCRLYAFNPTIELPRIVILDVTDAARESEITDQYWRCLDDLEENQPKTMLSRLTHPFNRTIKQS